MIRDKVLKYLYESGFVQFYTKKLLYREDINDLYEDYCRRCGFKSVKFPRKSGKNFITREIIKMSFMIFEIGYQFSSEIRWFQQHRLHFEN